MAEHDQAVLNGDQHQAERDQMANTPALDATAWVHNEHGVLVDGNPCCEDGYVCFFMHPQPFGGGDVWRCRFDGAGPGAYVGFACSSFDPTKWGQTWSSVARLGFASGEASGTTEINSDISQDGGSHFHHGHLGPYIPKTRPFDLALRCEAVSNVPQIQFDDDGAWHDFAPEGEGRTSLKAGPLFIFLSLSCDSDRLSDHRVDRPKPTKSAGKTKRAVAGAAEAEGGAAGAGSVSTYD